MLTAIALLMMLQDKTVLPKDNPEPRRTAVLQVPKLNIPGQNSVPHIQQTIQQAQIARRKTNESQPKLSSQSIDEIKAIRKRIGLQIFKDKGSDAEFDRQLDRIQSDQNRPLRILPIKAKTDSTSTIPTLAPTVERPRIAGFRLNPPSAKSLEVKTLDALFSAIQHLDQSALELEKNGQFEKSENLRKLSRKIQKQARTLWAARDN